MVTELEMATDMLKDLTEVERLLTLGDVSEAEHWISLLKRQYAARVYRAATGHHLPDNANQPKGV